MAETKIVAEPGKQEILLTRVLDAPRELVFKAYTDPELLVNWLGPKRLTMTIHVMDVKPGGSWRYTHRDTDGSEYGFHGVFHDVVSPERIVQTFEFEGAPGHVSLETLTLEDQNGKTKMTTVSVYQSVADRDMNLQAGMESGMTESMDRLAELLKNARLSQDA